MAGGQRRYSDYAIFYRTNAQSRVVEEALDDPLAFGKAHAEEIVRLGVSFVPEGREVFVEVADDAWLKYRLALILPFPLNAVSAGRVTEWGHAA